MASRSPSDDPDDGELQTGTRGRTGHEGRIFKGEPSPPCGARTRSTPHCVRGIALDNATGFARLALILA